MLILLILSFADYLYREDSYDDAITEYKRMLFFNPESTSIEFKIIRCYEKSGELEEAIDYSNKLLLKYYDKEIREKLSISLAKNYIKQGEFGDARMTSIDIEDEFTRHYLLGLSYLFEKSWALAIAEFTKINNDTLVKLAEAGERLPKKSVSVAGILSTIIPGLGHLYVGNVNKGIRSFLVNVISGYLTFINVKNQDYLSGSFIFSSLFHRFYLGGIMTSIIGAKECNSDKENVYIENIKYLLEY